MRILLLLITLVFVLTCSVSAQLSRIKGKVTSVSDNKPVPFANVIINNSDLGAIADTNGNYIIENVPPGIYNISCSFIGFKPAIQYEVNVTSVKPAIVNFELEENTSLLKEVEVTVSPFNKTEESPLSLKTINSTEIFRSPGGNRDISKVLQTLPGVGSSVSFRNDIIVRGGAPNENRFYIDGIEVPNINHFATQGSSGGPVGLINVNFIREVDFYSGAFPANRGNTLSSIIDFKQINGSTEKFGGSVMVGSSDVGLTLNGPTGKKSDLIFSVRRSYLQLLFKALSLPFLPTYNDFQLKENINFNNRVSLSIIGLGAIDDFQLNKTVNEGLTDSTKIERNDYIIGYIPVNEQWNYTIGANLKISSESGFTNIILSRNQLKNIATKYSNNTDNPEDLILDYNSSEIENKIRLEHTTYNGTWKFNYGAGYEKAYYTNYTFQKSEVNGSVYTKQLDSELSLGKFSIFAQAGKKLLEERLVLSLGLRTDASGYSASMQNLSNQLSPRFSASYSLTEKLFLNFNIGRYYQLPAYTVLGYRSNDGTLVNKENNVKYIRCDHLVGGVEYNPEKYFKITVEGFYKKYNNYPFLLNDSISLANLGGDFGVIGSEPCVSTSEGRSYGFEIFVQQKLSSTYYGILSMTFFRSEFLDKKGSYRPSSWDNRYIVNLTVGKKLKNNWEFGMKFRLLGGAPYTPYDIPLSSKKEIWDVTNRGIPDYDQLNEKRFSVAHGLDVRIDKKWFFKKLSFNAYLDIQNIYNFQFTGQPYLNVRKDTNGMPITDPSNPDSYQTYEIENISGNILPSIGLMMEF